MKHMKQAMASVTNVLNINIIKVACTLQTFRHTKLGPIDGSTRAYGPQYTTL